MPLWVPQSKMKLKFTAKVIPKYEMSRLNLRPKRSSRFPPMKSWKIEITKKCLKSWFHPSVGIPHQVLPATTPELSTSTLPRLNYYTIMSTTSCLNPVKTFGLDLWCMNNNPLSYVIIAPKFWFNKPLGVKKLTLSFRKAFLEVDSSKDTSITHMCAPNGNSSWSNSHSKLK